jgi:uncharacterized protein YidB (DUF937 family)
MGLLDQILGGIAGGQGGLGNVLGGGRPGGAPTEGGGLGDVIGGMLGGGRSGQSGSPGGGLGGMNPILMAVLGMLASRAVGGMLGRGAQTTEPGEASAGSGGLDGLMEQFRRAGMGSAVESWVGTGRNEEINGEQLQEMLGKDQIADLARQLGIPEAEAGNQVAQVLPEVVDRLTPEGKAPGNGFGDIGSMIEQLLRTSR